MEHRTVLIVEDNELNMKLVKSLLTLAGVNCLEAVDAEKGIIIAKQENPDLILMDIQLPGMDGLNATKQILENAHLKKPPIIALTSYAMDGDKEKALNAGCVGYISKPIDTRTFIDTISLYLNSNSKEVRKKLDIYKKKVLIVDDDPLNLKLLDGILSKSEYKVISAINGKEAIEMVKREMPDIILLDIMMPGLNGYDVTKALKGDPKYEMIPIVLITALDGEKEKTKGLEAGADEFINKPVNTVELNARIKSLLRMKEYGEQILSRSETAKRFFHTEDDQDHLVEKKLNPNILIVDDNKKDIKLIKTYLGDAELNFITAQSGSEVISNSCLSDIDLIILDILLPDINGYEICKIVKSSDKTRNIQILMVTSLQDLNSKIKGFEYGADDFLVKPVTPEEFRARAHALIRKKTYLDRLTRNHDFAVQSAITDKLTGLYDPGYFKHYLENELNRTKRQGFPVSLLMLDVDDFKRVNDEHGHPEGDKILQQVGKSLRANIREIDLAVRYGGDEFAVVMPWTDSESAYTAASRIIKELRNSPVVCGNNGTKEIITLSVGISSEKNCTADEIIKKADGALYQAKKQGKDQICVAS